MGCLDNRVAVITGAGRGIGREHAILFAAEGAAVVVNDLGSGKGGESAAEDPARDVVEEIEAAGGRAISDRSDVASSDGAQNLIETAIQAFGRVDVLVNNAGILRDRPIVTMTDDDWDTSIRVNLRGHFMPLRAVARHWRERQKAGDRVDGAVVNTSSESGVFANATQANYAAAKSAVATLTEVAAKEFVRIGVRVNGILPRARTRLTASIVPEARMDAFDRWDPGNVSPFVAYLASSRCAFTGQIFVVGGSLVQRVAPWSLDTEWALNGTGRWTVDELTLAVNQIGIPHNAGRLTGAVQ